MYPKAVARIIEELKRLPGVGERTAERLAFHLLVAPRKECLELAQSIRDLKEKVRPCAVCWNVSETEVCAICSDEQRDRELICVVEQPKDLIVLERLGTFRGLYHVLMGVLSPLHGMGPDDLKIKELIGRLEGSEVKEIIIATNPNTEGEATAIYLTKLIKPLGLEISRIGVGLPMGSDLEYADEVTVGKAIEGRRNM